jgi:DNA-binding response OmpR family regulator
LQEPAIHVDVVLSGINFSGAMDGFELSQWVKAHRPGIDVFLAATVQRAASTAGDLCEEGPMLSKPYQPETVVARIKQLLAERASRQRKWKHTVLDLWVIIVIQPPERCSAQRSRQFTSMTPAAMNHSLPMRHTERLDSISVLARRKRFSSPRGSGKQMM